MSAAVLSYGGGVQTAALCVLAVEGRLPHPDHIVMADTGREGSATWAYLDGVMRPYLAGAGLAVDVAPPELARMGLYGHNGDLLLPAYTAEGKLPTYCSVEWKRRVVRRRLRALGVIACELWLGFSVDELRRCHESGVGWVRHRFPLIDLRLTRGDCLRLVRAAGLPEPPKSSCWMCPHHSDAHWRDLRDRWPEDWEKACRLDEEIRAKDQRGGVWLHQGRTPLRTTDLTDQGPGPLFRACESGMCWT